MVSRTCSLGSQRVSDLRLWFEGDEYRYCVCLCSSNVFVDHGVFVIEQLLYTVF